MDRETVRLQRSQQVATLLAQDGEIRSVYTLANKIASNPREARKLDAKIRRCTPNAKGVIVAKSPLPYTLCKKIADVFGVQPSSVYIERLPDEEEEEASPAPRKHREKTATRPSASPPNAAPTVTVPNLGIKDHPADAKLIHTKRGFVLQMRVPVPLDRLRKLLDGAI